MTMDERLPVVALLDWFCEAPVEEKVLAGIARVRCYNLKAGEEILETISEAAAVIRFRQPEITARELQKMAAHCKVLVAASVGYDRIDLKAAAALGIPVVNLPVYCTEEVADSALCLMLMLARKTLGFVRLVEAGRWPFVGELDNLPALRLRDKTLGIVGLGRIGTAMALRCKALGMRVAFYDPFLRDGVEKALGGLLRCASLDELLRCSDVVSVHCNLTEQNRHMLNARALAQCKQGALLINTARGPLIDEAALVAALRSGALAAAALDVLEQEPYTDGHLRDVPNLVITPHAAHYSTESVVERRIAAAQVVADAILGRPLHNVVNGL